MISARGRALKPLGSAIVRRGSVQVRELRGSPRRSIGRRKRRHSRAPGRLRRGLRAGRESARRGSAGRRRDHGRTGRCALRRDHRQGGPGGAAKLRSLPFASDEGGASRRCALRRRHHPARPLWASRQCRRSLRPSPTPGSPSPTGECGGCRSQPRPPQPAPPDGSASFVLERDLHLRAVRLNLPFLELYVELADLRHA